MCITSPHSPLAQQLSMAGNMPLVSDSNPSKCCTRCAPCKRCPPYHACLNCSIQDDSDTSSALLCLCFASKLTSNQGMCLYSKYNAAGTCDGIHLHRLRFALQFQATPLPQLQLAQVRSSTPTLPSLLVRRTVATPADGAKHQTF